MDFQALFKGRSLPAAFVDLDAFDANIAAVVRRAKDKFVRVASKSVRCVALLRRLEQKLGDHYCGLMTYSGEETLYLARCGFDRLLIGYPVTGENTLLNLARAVAEGKDITFMADLPEHLHRLQSAAQKAGTILSVCFDVDMSSRFPLLYFGVRRSALTDTARVEKLTAVLQTCDRLRLTGMMGYEAQIAGLQDDVPGKPVLNLLLRVLKARSAALVARRRKAVVEMLQSKGYALAFVNGGGTGSLETTVRESAVSEVTAGSSFYNPGLFDAYKNFKHLPAAGFALEVTRKPAPRVVTCSGGGYIASGAAGWDKLPKVWHPSGAKLLKHEGAGEVQTPVRLAPPMELEIGDVVVMRHAKSGELCERFNTLLLIADGRVVGEVPTYRGEGMCFL
ncbi:MAG: alanine racemase [Bacteroidia bacterium]|nr:alanine racemase [Bacteroidia bacterium]MDW8332896.1 alanine racemase [Bacteroidia bacterium]